MVKTNHVTFHVSPVKKIKVDNKFKIFNTITLPIYSPYKVKSSNGSYKLMDAKMQIDKYLQELKNKYKSVKINKL